jgi:type IV pilus assembly protein PilB
MSRNRLGELLVREKRISLEQLREAQKHQKDDNISLGYALARLGAISDQEITDFLSEQYRVQSIDLSEYEIDREILKLISPQVCERHKIIPVSRAGSSLIVAMADPSNLNAIDDVKFLTGYNVEPVVSSESAILAALEKAYAQPEISYDDIMEGFDESEIEVATTDEDDNLLDLERASEDAPVVRLCNAILLNAIKQGASDIHVEPYERILRVRYRVDGVLHEEMTPPIKLKNAIASRLKIMSSLDIAERRLPQDGRIKLKLGKGREMDYRVSSVPTLWGEKIVLRLLDKSNLQLDMTKLGFEQKPLSDFRDSIHQPFGMVLVTGPTGSGKTTTLYSAMSDLNEVGTNVSTAEDPIEFNLMGINQVQMHEDIGLNFAAALRSFLRQDPDIIMVGEIRDFETAEIAVKAALTGHLVLSTLPSQHGRGAVPGDRLGQLRRGTASRTQDLRGMQSAGPHRRAGSDRRGLRGERNRHRGRIPRHRLQGLQRHRLQRPNRPLRGHAVQRPAPRNRASRRVHRRGEGRDDSERGCHATPCRPEQSAGRRHDDRRGGPGDRRGPLGRRCRLPLELHLSTVLRHFGGNRRSSIDKS